MSLRRVIYSFFIKKGKELGKVLILNNKIGVKILNGLCLG
jgi:hypothetical protein